MSQKVVITMIDDLDESVTEEVEPVEFGIDGRWLAIDLGRPNRDKLRKDLAPFIAAARKVKGGARRVIAKSAQPVDRGETARIREWAGQHGKNINDRGRLPREVLAAWREQRPELLSA